MNGEITGKNHTFANLTLFFLRFRIMNKIKIPVLFTFLMIAVYATAQTDLMYPMIQDSLSKLSSEIWKQKSDSSRLAVNEIFFWKFSGVLSAPTSETYPFDSIQGITRVVSVDGKIRIFTWNVPINNGSNKYFGFIQVAGQKKSLIQLISRETDLPVNDDRQIDINNWYGAIYYKLIETETAGKTIYTLLGWDGYTANSNRKFIDILSFDEQGELQLGQPVFKTAQGTRSRIILEYAEKANLLLRYDYQALKVIKGKRVKLENTWLLVMDRLVPMDPSMEGIRRYYVPSGDVYDGFVFRDGFWKLVEEIEIINNGSGSK